MGFRMRKSIKLAPGVRMTVTPRGVGVSAGGRGARLSAHSSGRVTRSIGIPGTGISDVKTISSGSRRTSTGRAPTQPARQSVPPSAPTPGFLAPKWEKALHKALITQSDVNELPKIAAEYEEARAVAALFEAIHGAIPAGNFDRARALVAWPRSVRSMV